MARHEVFVLKYERKKEKNFLGGRGLEGEATVCFVNFNWENVWTKLKLSRNELPKTLNNRRDFFNVML